MERNDQQLIADYLNGNEDTVAILIDRHLKAVFNFTYRLVGKSEDAEDITQETFLKMWRNLKKYRQGENFKTWLFTIARNTAIDWLRKKKSFVFSDFSAGSGSASGGENGDDYNPFAETLTDTEPLPDEIFAKAEEKKFLENALTKLSPAHREVLLLHYGEYLTFDEIGKILDQPLNTVKSRHRRALIELREIICAPK